MSESPPQSSNPGIAEDLGFRRSTVALCAAAAALLPGLVAWLAGSSLTSSLVVTACCGAALLAMGFAALAHLQRNLMQPLREVAGSLEQWRVAGDPTRVTEQGAPFLRPLLRRFNQTASLAVEKHQASQANLLSVEAAFDRLHSVLQSLHEAVLVVDAYGNVLLANRSIRLILPDVPEPFEGRPVLDLLTGELRNAVRDSIQRMDSRAAEEMRLTSIQFKGSIYELTVVNVRATRPNHNYGRVIVLVDVTKDHALHVLKDELLSSISHELRTPLTNMCSSCEILSGLDPRNEGEWQEFIEILGVESHRLKAMVDDIMEYSQIETGNTPWNIEAVNLVALARAAVEMMSKRAREKRLDVAVVTSHQELPTQLDPSRITEVLCRLIDNSIKFTPEGGKIRVTVDRVDDTLQLAVDDSGTGIKPDDRLRVFERFVQLGDLMTSKPPGAGLGLSICQRLVDKMGGTLWCEGSALGGAQFHIALPQLVSQPLGAD